MKAPRFAMYLTLIWGITTHAQHPTYSTLKSSPGMGVSFAKVGTFVPTNDRWIHAMEINFHCQDIQTAIHAFGTTLGKINNMVLSFRRLNLDSGNTYRWDEDQRQFYTDIHNHLFKTFLRRVASEVTQAYITIDDLTAVNKLHMTLIPSDTQFCQDTDTRTIQVAYNTLSDLISRITKHNEPAPYILPHPEGDTLTWIKPTTPVPPPRIRRGLDFIGDAYSWLFGLATEGDLESMKQATKGLANLTEVNTNAIKQLQDQFISVSQRIDKNMIYLRNRITGLNSNFQHVISNLTKDMEKTYNRVSTSVSVNAVLFKISVYLESASDTLTLMNSHLRKISHRYMHTYDILLSAFSGHLHPRLFNVKSFKELLTTAKQALYGKADLMFPDFSSLYYQLPLAGVYTQDQKVIVSIKIPIYQSHIAMDLWKILATPFPCSETLCQWSQLPDYIALTPDGHMFSELTVADLHYCTKPPIIHCPRKFNVLNELAGTCSYYLFSQNQNVKDTCSFTRIPTPVKSQLHHLQDNYWILAGQKHSDPFHVTCTSSGGTYQDIIKADKNGVVMLPSGCEVVLPSGTIYSDVTILTHSKPQIQTFTNGLGVLQFFNYTNPPLEISLANLTYNIPTFDPDRVIKSPEYKALTVPQPPLLSLKKIIETSKKGKKEFAARSDMIQNKVDKLISDMDKGSHHEGYTSWSWPTSFGLFPTLNTISTILLWICVIILFMRSFRQNFAAAAPMIPLQAFGFELPKLNVTLSELPQEIESIEEEVKKEEGLIRSLIRDENFILGFLLFTIFSAALMIILTIIQIRKLRNLNVQMMKRVGYIPQNMGSTIVPHEPYVAMRGHIWIQPPFGAGYSQSFIMKLCSLPGNIRSWRLRSSAADLQDLDLAAQKVGRLSEVLHLMINWSPIELRSAEAPYVGLQNALPPYIAMDLAEILDYRLVWWPLSWSKVKITGISLLEIVRNRNTENISV